MTAVHGTYDGKTAWCGRLSPMQITESRNKVTCAACVNVFNRYKADLQVVLEERKRGAPRTTQRSAAAGGVKVTVRLSADEADRVDVQCLILGWVEPDGTPMRARYLREKGLPPK